MEVRSHTLQLEGRPATTIEPTHSRVHARLQENLLAHHNYRKSMCCNKGPARPKLKKKKKKYCTYKSVHFIKLTLIMLMGKSTDLATSHSKLKQRRGLFKNCTLLLNPEICSGLQREAFRASLNSEFL